MSDVTPVLQNPILGDISEADALAQLARSILLKMNCHAIGVVQSFDPETQLAQVKIPYKKTYTIRRPDGVFDTKQVDYPLLLDVPCMFLGNKRAFLTFPVEAGDECDLLFQDRDIDNWYAGINDAPLRTSRLHSFADAVALIGLRSKANAIADFDQERARLQKGSAVVAVGKDEKVLIENNSRNLNALLQDLATKLQSLCTHLQSLGNHAQSVASDTATSNCVNGAPLTKATLIAATATQIGTDVTNIGVDSSDIASVASQIAELLE